MTKYYLIDTAAYSKGLDAVISDFDKKPTKSEIADVVDAHIGENGLCLLDYVGETVHLVMVDQSFEVNAKIDLLD